jgi:hypothetical protein
LLSNLADREEWTVAEVIIIAFLFVPFVTAFVALQRMDRVQVRTIVVRKKAGAPRRTD